MPEDTALHEAVRYGDLETAEELVRSGDFDLDQLGLFQWGCLHEAAVNGYGTLLRLLLQHGADPNCRDALRGCTALHYAAEADDVEAAEALIAAGARLDILTREGESPLDVALGQTRDLLLRKAPLLLKTDPDRIKENQELMDSLFKISSDTELSSSRSTSAQSINSVGSAELSFEYNSKKDVLKVRVWRLFDLLLPPAHGSPISAVFLRGSIQLGRRHVLKSDTEAVRAYPDDRHGEEEEGETQESVYRFEQPLHFRDVTPSIVAVRDLQITFLVRTRRPAKSVAISRLELPLKDAVHRVTKAVYPLRPLPEAATKLPATARLFGNATLRVPIAGRSTCSNPSLRGSRPPPCARSASDSELRFVPDTALNLGDHVAGHVLPLNGVELLESDTDGPLVTVIVHKAPEEAEEEMVKIPEGEEEENSLTHVTVHRAAGKEEAAVVEIPSDSDNEEEERETSLMAVTVHRSPQRGPSTALDVPLIDEEEKEEEEELHEVLSGCDNPTFFDNVEYLVPPARSSGLRVHRSAKTKQKEVVELHDLP